MPLAKEWKIFEFEELGSTNDKAVELSARPPAEKFVVIARRQTAGRGRRGRRWESPEGNLYMSLAFPLEETGWGQLVFVVSLSLLETVKKFAPAADLKLKWPNDVLLNNAKISGILLEKGSGMYIIVGIGVNLAVAPENRTDMLYRAASLRQNGISVERKDFFAAFLSCFDDNLKQWRKSGFAGIREKWLRHARGLNEKVRVNLPKESKSGIFRGIDENGLLLLEHLTQIEKISAGDVFFEKDLPPDETKHE